MEVSKKIVFIKDWILNYVNSMPKKAKALVIGISGGIDSSVTSTLCAMTGIKTIVFDIPNGYIDKFSRTINDTRKQFPNLGIIAGNVVTPEGVKILMDSGADGVKVGIGSGGVCDTTETTGIGYPQLSAVIECSEEVKKYNGFVVSDGGVKITGDISKAFAAGAGFVMLGSLLAAHKESMAPIIRKDNKNYRFVKGDIADNAKIKKILYKFNPDFIINFAAETHVDRSIDKPSIFINTNIF